jgi:hypothetical protein
MKAGGTFDLDAQTNDLQQVVDGNYVSTTLIKLPLTISLVSNRNFWGCQPNLTTPDGGNPLVPNFPSTRFQLPQPATSISLAPTCLDSDGNWCGSYPLQNQANLGNFGTDDPVTGFAYWAQTAQNYAFGYMRLNGQGIWWPMSLQPFSASQGPVGEPAYTGKAPGVAALFPSSGYSTLAGPISFIDWIGIWDGVGVAFDENNNPPPSGLHLLAIITANMTASGSSSALAGPQTYAVPNSSGRIQGTAAAGNAQKGSDILVRAGGTRGKC